MGKEGGAVALAQLHKQKLGLEMWPLGDVNQLPCGPEQRFAHIHSHGLQKRQRPAALVGCSHCVQSVSSAFESSLLDIKPSSLLAP
jgi:hypothetical protein